MLGLKTSGSLFQPKNYITVKGNLHTEQLVRKH